MTIYAIINSLTNICENTSMDDRIISEIEMPEPYFLLNLETTKTKRWSTDEDGNNVLVESIGDGALGFAWDGAFLIEPEPVAPIEP